METQNLSHKKISATFEEAKNRRQDVIKARGDLPHVTVERQLELLEGLSSFALGRFLIQTGGLNGYWTQYAFSYPDRPKESLPELETFFLESMPAALATQERFRLFKAETQKLIKEGCTLASIPCGLMGDLLELDFSAISDFTLLGFDLDKESLDQAEAYAKEKGVQDHAYFFQQNAWDLDQNETCDGILSNGLTIYEKDDQKVRDLFMAFYHALKKGGTLITSFLTPPPGQNLPSEWKMEAIDRAAALLQRILFVDVIEAKWQVFRQEKTIRQLLEEVGFKEINIAYDRAHVFPTVIAKK